MAKAAQLALPVAVADEIEAAAARSERSVGFLVHGALKAALALTGAATEPRRSIALSTDDDDPRDLGARLKKLAADKGKGLSLDDAIALAWTQRRSQILAWVERVASVNAGEKADELDDGLRQAADPATPAARLAELSKSVYPRVRVLVVENPSTTTAIIDAMKADREPVVRDAIENRRLRSM